MKGELYLTVAFFATFFLGVFIGYLTNPNMNVEKYAEAILSIPKGELTAGIIFNNLLVFIVVFVGSVIYWFVGLPPIAKTGFVLGYTLKAIARAGTSPLKMFALFMTHGSIEITAYFLAYLSGYYAGEVAFVWWRERKLGEGDGKKAIKSLLMLFLGVSLLVVAGFLEGHVTAQRIAEDILKR